MDRLTVVEVIREVQAKRRTYLGEGKLRELSSAVKEAPKAGIFIEAGCALGGSAAVIAAAKDREREFRLYDVFGMIPAPGERDDKQAHQLFARNKQGIRKGIQGDEYYGYRKDLLAEMKALFASVGLDFQQDNVIPVPGIYADTLAHRIDCTVALAHIDCDWFDSVTTCLRAIEPSLVIGGRMIFDDYYDFPGCKSAVDEYVAGIDSARTYSLIGRPDKRTMHLVRVK